MDQENTIEMDESVQNQPSSTESPSSGTAVKYLQLKYITSFQLQRNLISLFAKGLQIDWDNLARLPTAKRYQRLDRHIRQLADIDPSRHGELCSVLNLIDLVGRDARQYEVLEKDILAEADLRTKYEMDDFGTGDECAGRRSQKALKSRTPHNIAAWIYIASHGDRAKTGYSVPAKTAALRVWRRIAHNAAVIAGCQRPYTFFITEPTIDTSPEKRAELFAKAYKAYKRERTGIEDYPASITYQPRVQFQRYSTTAMPSLNYSMQHVENDVFDVREDKRADSFHLDYYPGRGYIRLSRVVDRVTTLDVAGCFVRHALGAEIASGRHTRHDLSVFMTPAYREKLKLPEEAEKRGERVWISAVNCAYYDQKGEVVSKNREYDFKWHADRDIFANIGDGPSRGGRESDDVVQYKREFLEVELSFQFCDYRMHEARPYYHSELMPRVYKVKIRPRSFDFLEKTKDIKPIHRQLIKDVLERAGLMPKTQDQINEIAGALDV